MLESAGGYDNSEIHTLSLETGEILQKKTLPNNYFGEGCEARILSDGKMEIYQLTWKERVV